MKLLTICALGGALGALALPAEVKLKASELPAAVQTALKEEAKGASIFGASKEREHGRVEYEVETKLDDKSRDLTFAEDGTLLEVEQEIGLASVPEAAKKTIERRAGTGKIRKVESVTRESQVSYEATVMRNGKQIEIAVNADGTPHKAD